MKSRKIFALLVSFVLIAFCLAACDDNKPSQPSGPCANGHTLGAQIVDKDPTCAEEGAWHKNCTVCGAESVESGTIAKNDDHVEVIDPRVEPTDTEEGKTEGKHCSRCEKVLIAQQVIPANLAGTQIKLPTLTLENGVYRTTVSNATRELSLLADVIVAKGATWALTLDRYGSNPVLSKIALLNEGENTFYIFVTNGNDVASYEIHVYRNHLYTVQFETAGGTDVASQRVEEGYTATLPAQPTRPGYTFDGWSYDFSTPVMGDVTVRASWKTNTDTPYKVEYYLENLAKNGYDLIETVPLFGTTDTTANAGQKSFAHFTFNSAKSVMSGNINGNGGLVLKVYYTRNTYTVKANNAGAGILSQSGSFVYETGTNLTLTATPYRGYEFFGWYAGETLLSSSLIYTTEIDKDVEARFKPIDAMAPFQFTSTATSCTVTGVKDKSVTELVMPDCVTSIDNYAFQDCRSLTDIMIPASVTSIGYAAFSYCNSLQTVTFVENSQLTAIGDSAFRGCSSLTNITIPASVTSIGSYAFYDCSSLASVYITDLAAWCNIRFSDYAANPLYYAKNLYVNGELMTEFVIPDGVTSIGEDAFYNCSSLTSITIPASVTSIGGYAFCGCSSLQTVTFAENSQLTSIGEFAFFGCSSLTSITIPASVTSIGGYAFYNCSNLQTVTFAENSQLTSIGSCAFYDCSSLASITIPASVTSIGAYAFESCSSLTSITIPASVTSIGDSAFYYCSSLASITIPAGVTSIGKYAFYNCSSLNTVYYGGSAGDWSGISIRSYNSDLENATRYDYSETYAAGCWHWVNGAPTLW